VPDASKMNNLVVREENHTSQPTYYSDLHSIEEYGEKPIIINDQVKDKYQKSEVVDETLSLNDMEKDMIKKALKKYQGKRKDAAEELGISERTLYRKIKEYEIPD
ncbi:MAG: hypothetical protein RLZZ546_45, partial [Bacteroidota bacterium]|jgi:transcriptional regulator with PAS, ATPase and Fis domain